MIIKIYLINIIINYIITWYAREFKSYTFYQFTKWYMPRYVSIVSEK